MRAETLAEQLFFTTCRIEAHSRTRQWIATGFVYAVQTDKGPAHFLITNKHVLRSAEELTIRMIRKSAAGTPWLGEATQVAIQQFGTRTWTGHPDAAVDVGVMPLLQVLQEMENGGASAFFRSVTPEICLTPEREQELDAIEEVTFIGYPNGLYDAKNYLPILRTGTTATPISVDYQGAPAFLIDASVFPGSSGSPVFIANRGMYLTRGGSTVIGARLICLGVLAATHTRQVEGSVDVLPARLVAAFDEPIDLGVVYKARCIDECVAIVLDQRGLRPTQSSTLIETSTRPSSADEALADSRDPVTDQ
jgi:V8-like Glu-specific endopeptidase